MFLVVSCWLLVSEAKRFLLAPERRIKNQELTTKNYLSMSRCITFAE